MAYRYQRLQTLFYQLFRRNTTTDNKVYLKIINVFLYKIDRCKVNTIFSRCAFKYTKFIRHKWIFSLPHLHVQAFSSKHYGSVSDTACNSLKNNTRIIWLFGWFSCVCNSFPPLYGNMNFSKNANLLKKTTLINKKSLYQKKKKKGITESFIFYSIFMAFFFLFCKMMKSLVFLAYILHQRNVWRVSRMNFVFTFFLF